MKLWVLVLCAVLLLCAVGCQAVPPESSAPEQSLPSFAEMDAFVDKVSQLSAGDSYADVVALLGEPTEQKETFLRYSVVPGVSTLTVSFQSDDGSSPVTEGRVSEMVLSVDLLSEGAADAMNAPPGSTLARAMTLQKEELLESVQRKMAVAFLAGETSVGITAYYPLEDGSYIELFLLSYEGGIFKLEDAVRRRHYFGSTPPERLLQGGNAVWVEPPA